MIERKIKVPEGMLSSVYSKFRTGQFAIEMHELAVILEAAIRWLLDQEIPAHFTNPMIRSQIRSYLKLMFAAPDPNPAIMRVKQTLTGCTLTAGDAVELIDFIRMCTKPEEK